jgi:3',5'-cyclic AMP phosphodiesterase CpdA
MTMLLSALTVLLNVPCFGGPSLAFANDSDVPSYAGFSGIDITKPYFIIVGDTQSTSHWEFWRERNDKARKQLTDEIVVREPAFVINLGDLTTRGSSKKHWQNFDALHKTVLEKRIPYFPILGNHEYYGNKETALRNFFDRFPHLQQRHWYSFTWKNVAFIMLDSNFSSLSENHVNEQNQWYLGELERYEHDQTISCVIVCCHEAPFTNSRVVAPSKKSKLYFAEPFLKFKKASLFFTGHAHTYEHFQIGGKTFIVSGGGGGPRHKVTTATRQRRYDDRYDGGELRFMHFCQIEQRDKSLLFRVFRLEKDGTFSETDSLAIQGST